MEFSVKSGSPEKQRSACIVVGVFEPRRLSPVAEQLDKISDGYISSLLRRGDLEGKPGQMLLLHQVPGVLSERVLLVGCGKERELGERQYKEIIQKTISTLNETGSMEAVCFLTELHVKGRDTYWKVRQAVEATKDGLYTFNQFKSVKPETRRPLRKLVFNVPTRRELSLGEKSNHPRSSHCVWCKSIERPWQHATKRSQPSLSCLSSSSSSGRLRKRNHQDHR